jgi:hypothetical protein
MRGYKHIEAVLAYRFESGQSIRVGTYAYYRGIEEEGWDRGDPYEGRAINAPGPIIGSFGPANPLTEVQLNALRLVGIHFDPNTPMEDVHISGNEQISEIIDGYIFCASSEPDLKRVAKKGEAIFEITALRAFANALSDSAPKLLQNPVVRSDYLDCQRS